MLSVAVLLLCCCAGPQAELQSQKNIMDAQRELLEQQQSVLRKLAHARQALVDQGKLPASQDKS
jgi:hypothetical protein